MGPLILSRTAVPAPSAWEIDDPLSAMTRIEITSKMRISGPGSQPLFSVVSVLIKYLQDELTGFIIKSNH
jgi:hypothetical protein